MSDALLSLISTQLTRMQHGSGSRGVSIAEYNAMVDRANANAEIARRAEARCAQIEKYADELERALAINKENVTILQGDIARHNEYEDKIEAELEGLRRSR